MDKKNTILLTVIAVATLLVAVVGATFAYYSVQVSNSKTAVNVNASAGSVGVLTLDAPVQNLYMNLLPVDMIDFQNNTSYYATQTTNVNGISNKSTNKGNFIISQLGVSGGDENTSYTCKAKLKITLDTTENSMGKVLKAGDAKLYLTSDNVTIGNDFNESLDLHDLLDSLNSEESKSKEYDIIYKINGNDKKTATIKADLELINKSSKVETNGDAVQNYLAGKNLKVTIQVVSEGDKLDCSIDAAPAE